jgi:hypothetical protein
MLHAVYSKKDVKEVLQSIEQSNTAGWRLQTKADLNRSNRYSSW